MLYHLFCSVFRVVADRVCQQEETLAPRVCLLLVGSFLFNWLDLLAFSLSGLKAEGTSCAAMAYVMADLHREGAKLGKRGSFIYIYISCFLRWRYF